MKHHALLFLLLLPIQALGQKQDYNWLWGGAVADSMRNETVQMDFIDDVRSLKRFPTNGRLLTDMVNASISDAETGELLFYTNGCVIVNAAHEVMEGGDSINYEPWMHALQSDCSFGYPFPQNTFIVPDPGNEDGYYVIHKPGFQDPNNPAEVVFPEIWTTYVDMKPVGGKVIYKNSPVFKTYDTPSGYTHVIKHENNKDWWFIQMEDTTNVYYKFLINELGVEVKDTQNIGPKLHWDFSSGGQAKFSPLGDQWALANRYMGLMIYDFDRNTAELSNLRTLPIYREGSFAGMEWSPSGRFIYVSMSDTLYQIDTYESNLEAGKRVVGVWDGTNNPFATLFGYMMLGPDCRIYMSSYSSTKTIHVINNPDGLGGDCDFRQHGLDLLGVSTGTISIPNFPNFRLGIGPPCNPDIATFTNHALFESVRNMQVFPNPASDVFYINIEKACFGTLSVFSAGGHLAYNRYLHSEEEIVISSLSAGWYVVRFVADSGWAYAGRLVVGQ